MVLVQILLPLADNRGRPFDPDYFAALRAELTARFGGLTAFTRAPAEGVWAHGGRKSRDQIVVVEVMAKTMDRPWWRYLRQRLERDLKQEKLIIRYHTVNLV